MIIKCPLCGGECESNVEPDVGQHVECPYCSNTFQYGVRKERPTRISIPDGANVAARRVVSAASDVGKKTYERINNADWEKRRGQAQAAMERSKSAAKASYEKGNELMDKLPFLKSKRNKMIAWGIVGVVGIGILTSLFSSKEVTEPVADAKPNTECARMETTEPPKSNAKIVLEPVAAKEEPRKMPKQVGKFSNEASRVNVEYLSVVREMCGGKRITGDEWNAKYKALANDFESEFRRCGYWAMQIQSEGMAIMVGLTTDSRTGYIREGLGGGFTYPKWMPKEDAAYIWARYRYLEALSDCFAKSEYLMSYEEEQRLKEKHAQDPKVQESRRNLAQRLFNPLCFDESRYLYVQKKHIKVMSCAISDRDWPNLKSAHDSSDWLSLINMASGRNDKLLPEEDVINDVYKKLISRQWILEVEYKIGHADIYDIEIRQWVDKYGWQSARSGRRRGYAHKSEASAALEFTFSKPTCFIMFPLYGSSCSDAKLVNTAKTFYDHANKYDDDLKAISQSVSRRRYDEKEAERRRSAASKELIDWTSQFIGKKIFEPKPLTVVER